MVYQASQVRGIWFLPICVPSCSRATDMAGLLKKTALMDFFVADPLKGESSNGSHEPVQN